MEQVGFFDVYTLFIFIPTAIYLHLRLTGNTTPYYNYIMTGMAAFLWGTKFVSVYGTTEPFFLGVSSQNHHNGGTSELNLLRYAFLFVAVAFFQINGWAWKQKIGNGETEAKQPEDTRPRRETKKTY